MSSPSHIFTALKSPTTLTNAFERVAGNHGCCGCDGVSIDEFERDKHVNLQQLTEDLAAQTYHPFPLMRFPIPKKGGSGVRWLSVPSVRDRIAQAAAYLVTKPIFEAEFESMSHAYREGRGVQTAVKEIEVWRDKGFQYAVDADIDAYFDNVPHDLLLKKLEALIPEPPVLRLFRKWIKAEVYDGKNIWRLNTGIPQGSVVSPIMANLFLDELDELMISLDKKLVRYADDFLILSKTQDEAQENIDLTDMILEDMHLSLNQKKTKIVSFEQGFKFLGAIFLHDEVYVPEPQKRQQHQGVRMPPPLTFKRYLELKSLD
jgi:RNA-directed DNA polymerase